MTGTVRCVDLADLEYELPVSAIAQHPVEPRDDARLLVDRGPRITPRDARVHDLGELVGDGDVVVLNSTKVFPARVNAEKPTGGAVEVLLVERLDDRNWMAMVKPSRRVPDGTELTAGSLRITVGGRNTEDGRTRRVEVDVTSGKNVFDALDIEASVALPPYVTEPLGDPDRYQTVYAHRPGSVAAPTAGLHLTQGLIDTLRSTGAKVLTVDLEVGLGTFLPVTEPTLDRHVMHRERFGVDDDVLAACADADRTIAVGTTVVRALEASARGPHTGSTDLFIRPGFDFRVVDALLTNFHQPRSTLLALLAAFVGPRWRDLYGHALAHGYRFLSFGDAMFVPQRMVD